jgi:hypothetical protein
MRRVDVKPPLSITALHATSSNVTSATTCLTRIHSLWVPYTSKGHACHSPSLNEVIAQEFPEWGEKRQDRLNNSSLMMSAHRDKKRAQAASDRLESGNDEPRLSSV